MPVSSPYGVADPVLDDASLADAVRDAAQALPRRLRMVLYLTDIEGLSYGQSARVMGTSADAVAGDLRTARRWLRIQLRPAIQRALAG